VLEKLCNFTRETISIHIYSSDVDTSVAILQESSSTCTSRTGAANRRGHAASPGEKEFFPGGLSKEEAAQCRRCRQ